MRQNDLFSKPFGKQMGRMVLGSVCAVLVATMLYSCDGNSSEEDPENLNFLIIMADDAGWNDVGYQGSKIRTPNIDRIANEGVQLNRFYASPTCSPSRASLFTGMPSSRFGIVKPISGRSEKALPDSLPTLAGVLSENGYQTGLSGKWHLGLKPESGPAAYGFDYSYGFLHGQIDQYSHEYKNGDISWHENGEFKDEEGHATDLITDNVLQQLDKYSGSDDPFFIHVAYTAPHVPLQEEERWTSMYDTIFQEQSKILFSASMTHMDHGIGKILDALEKHGLDDNTVVMFMSDNGAQKDWYPGDHLYDGRFEPCPVLGSNDPLRDWKTSVYEGGIRIPAAIKIPGYEGVDVFEEFVAIYDIFPTMLQMAGIDTDFYPALEGIGFYDALTGEGSLPERYLYLRGHLGACVIKTNGDKIIWFEDEEQPLELYNVLDDPEEENNLAEEDEVLMQEMQPLLEKNLEADEF